MSLDTGPSRPRGPLAWSVKVTLTLGLAATALAHHVAKPIDKPPAQLGSRAGKDPEVTGSLGARAQSTRLDPCAVRAGGRD